MKRVLVITHNWPHGNHSGQFVKSLVDLMATRGYESSILCPLDPDCRLFYSGGLATKAMHHPWLAWRHHRAMIDRTKEQLRGSLPYSVVHAHWLFPGGYWAYQAGVKDYVLTLHGTDVELIKWLPPIRLLAKRILNRAKAVVAVSSYLADVIYDHFQIPCTVIPMPYDDRVFVHIPDIKREDYFLFIGRFTKQKGFDTVLHGLAWYRQMFKQGGLVAIGRGEVPEYYRRIIEQFRLIDYVTIMQPRPARDIADLMRHAKALIIPSRREGFGLVAVEAMATGTPVIASDTTGLRGIVQHGVNGLLFNVNSLDGASYELYKRMRIMDEPEIVERLVRGGLQSVENYRPQLIAEKYDKIYKGE